MTSLKARTLSLLLGALAVATTGGPAVADDTEIFLGQNTSGVKPNILFVIDTSGSMETEVVTQNAAYDPNTTYAGSCTAGRIYWVRAGGGVLPPACTTDNWFDGTAFRCKAGLDAITTAGKYDAADAAQYDPADTRWEQIRSSTKSNEVECRADAGVHGPNTASTSRWATDSGSLKWTTNSANRISWSANNTDRDYIFYNANYMNWWNNPVNVEVRTRLEIVRDVTVDLLNAVQGVNVGLMRYSHNVDDGCDDPDSAEGGMVTYPMSDIDAGTARADMVAAVQSYNASGCTPLSETLFEATQYLMGGTVDYGINSRIFPGTISVPDPMNPMVNIDIDGLQPSVAASLDPSDPAQYLSPMNESCQKTFIVYLTDGEPTSDTSADTKITGLPGFTGLVSATCDGTGDGHCLDDLAAYLNNADLNGSLPGKQNVVSYWIGFGPEVTGSALLQTTATRGGGQFYNADNTSGLASVLTTIVTQILQTNTTFTAPSVSVNAFNRTQTLADLYVSVFRPEQTYRWPGNVKKYRVTDGEIRDADDRPAVDPGTGFFLDGARSYWSAATDGQNVQAGGSAHRQPADPDTRKVYTNITAGEPDLTASGNALTVGNTAISDAVLGVGGAGQPTRADLIEWVRGRDVQDDDGDSNDTEARFDMGDPIHGKPGVVIYGGTAAAPDVTLYSPTNDGLVHAIDTDTGDELWSFMPADHLDSVADIYLSTIVNLKHYGLDSEVRVLKYDVDQDGIVESSDGDKVYLYFGQGRGGSNYYALDVTDRDRPRHLWTIGPAQLPGIGQTWSAPIVSRVNISGATQNSQKLVLIFGGGYDDTQDSPAYNTDTSGNGVYMIDAVTGALLWRASNIGANRNLARMVHAISSNVAVLDLDGDTYADRMYAGDMGGLLWRFDIYNGSPVANLVTGGVIADLGPQSLSAPRPQSETRRMYNTPDVALMRRRGRATFFNIGIGTGYRGHPLNIDTYDRFYAVRDYLPFTKRTQLEYNALTPYTDANMVDVTTTATPSVPDNSPGWKLELRLPGGWTGEKVLAESRTFNNSIFFPTYLPNNGTTTACEPAAGRNRVYIVSAFDGAPVLEQDGVATDTNGDGNPELTVGDRYSNLDQSGIAPETIMLFPGGGGGGGGTDPVVCLNGAEVLGACTNFNSRIRTFWRESAAN